MEMNSYQLKKPAGGGKTVSKESCIQNLFSVRNFYETDKNDMVKSKYKLLSILGLKFKIKTKLSRIEKHLLHRISVLKEILYEKDANLYSDFNYISAREDINKIYESTEPEDKALVDALYKNLDETAKNHLTAIFTRNKRVVDYKNLLKKLPLSNKILTKDELEQFNKTLQFKKEVEFLGDCYKWHDYFLPVDFFQESVFIYKHGTDSLINKDIKGVIIDAGANIGDSGIMFDRNFPDNKIICFEPEEHNLNLLQKTFELNKPKNITVEKLGIGDEVTTAYINNAAGGSKVSEKCEKDEQKINITTIDKYVKDNNIKVGLIKVDIEGFESNLIRGAQETLRTQAPTLLISIYHSTDDFYKLKPMIEEVMKDSKFTYRYDFFQPIYNSAIAECLLTCECINKEDN